MLARWGIGQLDFDDGALRCPHGLFGRGPLVYLWIPWVAMSGPIFECWGAFSVFE